MAWFLILQYILCPLALLVQVLGLILLYRRRQVSRNRNQIYILIGLCQTESALAIFNILYMFELLPSRVIIIFEVYISILYYSFMILLTSDRFLVFYLNMKYPIYCTPKKFLKVVFAVVAVPMILFLILALAIQFEQIKLINTAIIMQYVYISVDNFYIFIVTITYTYIFIQFRRRKKRRSNMTLTKKKNQDHFNLTLPTLVIATFILFNVCPNFIGIFIITIPGDEFSMESEIPRVLYTLGWISDPLIYLCSIEPGHCPIFSRKRRGKPLKFPRVQNEKSRTTSVILKYCHCWLPRIYFVYFSIVFVSCFI